MISYLEVENNNTALNDGLGVNKTTISIFYQTLYLCN